VRGAATLVNVHAATHPAAGLSRPSKVEAEAEAEAEPTEDDLHSVLDAEKPTDPEEKLTAGRRPDRMRG